VSEPAAAAAAVPTIQIQVGLHFKLVFIMLSLMVVFFFLAAGFLALVGTRWGGDPSSISSVTNALMEAEKYLVGGLVGLVGGKAVH